jgi:phosphoribosyl-AMP cyclohydrolase
MTEKLTDIEEGLAFTPKFDANGLISAVVTDAKSSDVLMVAHMNEEALRKTIASREAWYYSRSRKTLWKKGETSGHIQRVVELRVEQQGGGACHTGRRSCFYRAVPLGKTDAVTLELRDADKTFDPGKVYK